MKRRFASWGLLLSLAMVVAQLLHAIGDSADPSEKVCAQNLHQIATAIRMYLQDYDERFPLMYERESPTGAWRWNEPVPVPSDWRDASSRRGQTVWANSLNPYLGNRRNTYWNLRCPATLPAKVAGVDYSTRVKSPIGVSYTFNGYLHEYPLSAVSSPDNLPMVWEGLGREYLIGFALTNPILRCDRADKLCLFTPCTDPSTTYPRGEVRLPRQSVWLHSNGMFFVMVDGKLVSRRLGVRLAPNSSDPADPFDQYNANGIPAVARTNACGHLSLFAPR